MNVKIFPNPFHVATWPGLLGAVSLSPPDNAARIVVVLNSKSRFFLILLPRHQVYSKKIMGKSGLLEAASPPGRIMRLQPRRVAKMRDKEAHSDTSTESTSRMPA